MDVSLAIDKSVPSLSNLLGNLGNNPTTSSNSSMGSPTIAAPNNSPMSSGTNSTFMYSSGGGNGSRNAGGNNAGKGDNFSLASMYEHFQVGGGSDMHINASSIDFSGTSQRQLGLTGMKVGDKIGVNLFKSGINANSLAFGKLSMTYNGNDQFSISRDRFDFNIEWQNGFTARNAGTVLGGAINYNLMISPAAALVPLIFGGSYDVYFNGTTYIPK